LILAALVATSAMAQSDVDLQQPVIPVQDAPNQPPAIASFGPDKSSPQEAGAVITWTAKANDSENESILYRFILNGQPVTGWQPQGQLDLDDQ